MPTNKHAIIRYRTIDRCLRDIEQQWTWKELAEACNRDIYHSTGRDVRVSERTIKYDIAAMRSNEVLSYFAPIEYDRKEKTYYYSNPKYTLTESPINKSDTQLLNSAISLLEQFMEVQEVVGIHNILTKLESSLDRRKDQNEPIIQFDHEVDAPGQKWLHRLYQSIKKREALTILYQAFGKNPANRIISPQLLKEYKGRWYLLSFDHGVKDSRVYALDRIKTITPSITSYLQLEKVETKKYFDQVVGVSVLKDKKIEEVIFEVYGLQVHYFKTKPLHASQRLLEETTDRAIFSITVLINYELISELISYHTNLKVLSPPGLQLDIKTLIDSLSKYYFS